MKQKQLKLRNILKGKEQIFSNKFIFYIPFIQSPINIPSGVHLDYRFKRFGHWQKQTSNYVESLRSEGVIFFA